MSSCYSDCNVDTRGPTHRGDVCSRRFFFQAEDGIRDVAVTGVQTCALPICAAAGALRTILCFIEIGLLDADIFPVDVEFVGDNHGETGFYTLANLWVLAHDGHDAIRCDADEGGGNESGGRGLRRLGKKFSEWIEMECNEDASAGDSGDAEKTAAIEERGLHRASFLLSSLVARG